MVMERGMASPAKPSAMEAQASSPSPVLRLDRSNVPPFKLIVTYGTRRFERNGVMSTVSSWSWDINVDRDDKFVKFVGLLNDKNPWSNDEGVVLSRWCRSKNCFIHVSNDANVVNMFADNEEGKVIRVLVQFCKKGQEDEFAHSLLEPVPPSSPAQKIAKSKAIVEDLTQDSQFEYEMENSAGQQPPEKGYVGEDHVGKDEEYLYLDGSDHEEGGGNGAGNDAEQNGSSDVEEDSDEEEEDSDGEDMAYTPT